MPQPTFGERLRYAFDNSLSRGPIVLLAWLAVASGGFIAAMALLVWVTGIAPEEEGGGRPGVIKLAWMALMRTLDAGTMGGDAGSWAFLLAMLAVTFGGIFVISTLIGSITSGIEEKLDELRKGRSRVLERDHVVVLGWSSHVFSVVSELLVANQSQPRACLVVLGEKSKVEMEDELRERLGDTGRTRLICRTGDPTSLDDLDLVSVQTSRSIVVLPPEGEGADATVIKTLLAITNSPRRRPEPYHLVAAVQEARSLSAARLASRGEATLFEVGDLLTRITAQTCRQSGLSVVYQELLDFDGDEIYLRAEPTLIGRTYGEALFAYEKAAVIGLAPRGQAALLNPDMGRRLEAGDRIVAVVEDDSVFKVAARASRVDEARIRTGQVREARPERTLVLGGGPRVPRLLRELAAYVAPGSEALVVTPSESEAAHLAHTSERLSVRARSGDATDRELLDALDLPGFDHIIVLSDEQREAQQADARTLFTLLHLRDVAERAERDFSIVTEMRDPRNRELAAATRADDFIVGARLVSLMLAQLTENHELLPVFDDLFDPEGCEIYLKPAEDYVEPGQPVTFDTVLEAGRRRGHTAFGYRLQAHASDADKAYGVVINPRKSEPVTFGPGDRVIVLAED